MKTRRRGLLFTALTLVLGAALLTTTIAAPQLRQSQRAAGASLAIDISDSNTQWGTGVTLDVFGTDPFVPGSEGNYLFTIVNNEAFEVAYTFTISEGPETAPNYLDFPIEYSVDGSAWMRLDVLREQAFTGILTPGASHQFELEWRWPGFIDHAQDLLDTALGMEQAPYQILLHVMVEGEPLEYPPGPGCSWMWWLIPAIPAAFLAIVIPIIVAIVTFFAAMLGLVVIGCMVCWFCRWRNNQQCPEDEQPATPPPGRDPDLEFLPPPPTGDNTMIAIATAMTLMFAGGAAWLLLRKRNEE